MDISSKWDIQTSEKTFSLVNDVLVKCRVSAETNSQTQEWKMTKTWHSISPHTRLLCTGPIRKSMKMAAREEMWTRNNGWARGCYEQHLCELSSLFTERFSQNEWLLEVLWASLFRTIPRCPMSEQECRIDHFRVTLVAKALCPYASSLKFCQTSGKFSHVDEVLSYLSMYVAAPRVL